MKRIWLMLGLLSFYVPAYSLFGDGTINNGFHGDITGNITFPSGNVYVVGEIKITASTLTILHGTTLIISGGVEFVINTGGSISALGTQSNPILFSARDLPWGGLRFRTQTTGSEFQYCTFKNGLSSSSYPDGGAIRIWESPDIRFTNCDFLFNTAMYYDGQGVAEGGAIYALNSTGLSIRDCNFRNNSAQDGGAILIYNANCEITGCTFEGNSATKTDGRAGAVFVHAGADYNILIDRCKIYSNTTPDRTGGIHFDTGSGGIVQNCLIYNNSSTVGGGVSMGSTGAQNDGTVNILNCVIAQNYPCDLTFRTSIGFFVRNSVMWGSDASVMYIPGHGGGPPVPSNLINCAVQGATNRDGSQIDIASTFNNSFKLNSLNSAANGPNFFDPQTYDYRINFTSPCRDMGTLTGTPATPTSDFLGQARIGNCDIGAYEIQYSRWNGSSDAKWTAESNWESSLDPQSGISDIIIPSGCTNYPTELVDQDFVIGNSNHMIIEPGARLTLRTLTNNGTLNLKSDANGIASLILDSFFGSGSNNIQLYLTGGGDSWHYISSPVADLSTDNFAVGNDLAQFVESLAGAASNWQAGWVAWDGWLYSEYPADVYNYDYDFDALTLGKGYNYWNATPHTFNFSGTINTAAPSLALTSTGTGDWSGYNLIGNPFTSGLNIQSMFNDPGWPTAINEAVYYTSNGLYYVYGNDVAVPSTTQSQIPPMQGFFVRATSGGTYSLPWVKAHNSGPRFKGEKSSVPLVRLSISANGKSEETVVRFNEKAKAGNDTEFDAPRFISSQNSPSIYTSLNGTDYTINGLPFPETSVEIPVTVKLLTEGNHVVTALEIQELDDYNILLTDKIANATLDMKSNKEYAFSASSGLIKDRFILAVTNKTTGTEDPISAMDLFSTYEGFGMINILPLVDDWNGKTGSVSLIDITGKTLIKLDNLHFATNSLIQLSSPRSQGIFLVEIKSGVMRYVGKVIIR